MATEENPYAAPQSVSVAVSPVAAGLYFRSGRLLGVRDRAELPDVCVITNTAGDPKHWRKQRIFTSSPAWAWVGILGGPLILLLLMALAQRKAKVTFSLCRQSHRRILTRHLTGLVIAFGSFSLGLGIGFAGLVPNQYAGYPWGHGDRHRRRRFPRGPGQPAQGGQLPQWCILHQRLLAGFPRHPARGAARRPQVGEDKALIFTGGLPECRDC
jgi:hypothetical protein